MSTQNDLELTLRLIKDSMSREAEPNGAITDTIWMLTGTETVFDALDRAIEQASPLLSRIAELESRIDALSKDAERYRWLTTHYKYTNDSMAELWFDKDVENSDSKESIDRSIDAAISAREGE